MEFLQSDHRPLKILHLDDHDLFLTAIRTIIHSHYPKAIVEEFNTNEKAFNRLMEFMQENTIPDLILTDYTHPGPNGLEFARQVKSLCGRHGITIPVAMVSMVARKYILPEELENCPLDAYISKASSAEDIFELINTLVPPKINKN